MPEKLNITQWAPEDRPREKLLQKGLATLSDAELIAILIGSGNRNETAVALSQRILEHSNNNLHELGRLGVNDLVKNFVGIGEAKAISIIAALELGRRRKVTDVLQRKQISSPSDAAEVFMSEIGDLHHEEFWVMLLNQNNRIIRKEKLTQGGLNETSVDIRLLIKRVLDAYAPALIVCHNHPSGNPKASSSDIELTKKIKEACSFFQLNLLDHLIVTQNSYFSFSDEELL